MTDDIIKELTRRIEALEKKYTEVNYPYQRPPYPCVVADDPIRELSPASETTYYVRPFLLSDGQIIFADRRVYEPGASMSTAPTTLSKMARHAGIEIAPADEKKKTAVVLKIFEKFGGMRWAYMGEFMVSDQGDLYPIRHETPQGMLDKLEKRTAELGEPFKRDDSASDWDNIRAALAAYYKAYYMASKEK